MQALKQPAVRNWLISEMRIYKKLLPSESAASAVAIFAMMLFGWTTKVLTLGQFGMLPYHWGVIFKLISPSPNQQWAAMDHTTDGQRIGYYRQCHDAQPFMFADYNSRDFTKQSEKSTLLEYLKDPQPIPLTSLQNKNIEEINLHSEEQNQEISKAYINAEMEEFENENPGSLVALHHFSGSFKLRHLLSMEELSNPYNIGFFNCQHWAICVWTHFGGKTGCNGYPVDRIDFAIRVELDDHSQTFVRNGSYNSRPRWKGCWKESWGRGSSETSRAPMKLKKGRVVYCHGARGKMKYDWMWKPIVE